VPPQRIRHVIANGVPGTEQPAFALSAGGPLTDEQIESLVQGLRAAWWRPDALRDEHVPPYAAPLGDPERGSAVYAAACASCHGGEGSGGSKARSIVHSSYLALASAASAHHRDRGTLGPRNARLARSDRRARAVAGGDLGRRRLARHETDAGPRPAGRILTRCVETTTACRRRRRRGADSCSRWAQD